MNDLLPCPFCQGPAYHHQDTPLVSEHVGCESCGLQCYGVLGKTPKEIWDTRIAAGGPAWKLVPPKSEAGEK